MLLEGAQKFKVASFVGFGRESRAMAADKKNLVPKNVLVVIQNSSNTIKQFTEEGSIDLSK